jgi:acyl-CoA thioester hydrolase
MSKQDKPVRRHRSTFPIFRPITTRWMDNDAYGHVNNVHYYSYFDSAVNGWLVEQGLLSINESPVIGLVVESGCAYFESVAFPERLEAGISVAHLGRSSVRYEIGIFKEGEELAAAQGHFVHVYVDRETQRPVEIPGRAREALSELSSTAR